MLGIGLRIKQLRKSHHLTQKDIGVIVNLHDTSIGRIEKEELIPTCDIILALSEYFNVTCDFLIRGKTAEMQMGNEDMIFLNLLNKLNTKEKNEVLDFIQFKIYQKSNNCNNSII